MKTIPKKNNEYYYLLKDDIFDSILTLINGGNNGCSVIVPHVCNNVNLFGAGFAAAVAKHYPIVKENFHLLVSKKNLLGHTQFVTAYKDQKFGHQLIFANMIAQNGIISKNNNRPLNYYALSKCMGDVSGYVSKFNISESRIQIHAPKFGSGLAGGNWNFIQELIKDIWNPHNVFVYCK